MTSADPPAKKSFADRLNVLMDTIPNPSGVEGRAWTNTELHDALQTIGVDVSRPYIGQLRNGQKDNPGTLYVDVRYEVRGVGDPRSLVFPFYIIPDEPGAGARKRWAVRSRLGNATSRGSARTVMPLAMSSSPAARAVGLTGSSRSGTSVRTQ